MDTIERIEIVKGPASSRWGSCLGGVINIITRQIGYAFDRSQGAVKMSFGERNTRDHSAWIEGMLGNTSLYLFGGRQDSNGLRASRFFENNSFLSKAKIRIARNAEFNASFGYSEPYLNIGDYESEDFTAKWRERVLFTKADFQYALPFDFSLNVSLHHLKRRAIQMNDVLGLGPLGREGDLYMDSIYEEETTGGDANLLWRKNKHTVIFGAEFGKAELVQTLEAGPFLQAAGAPPVNSSEPAAESWAIYLNDTVLMGKWAVTPGLRYDYNNIVGSFVSPSLGITYELGVSSVLRASVSRGFTTPPLSSTSSGRLFLDPNPNLEYEKVWSYQAGIESKTLKHIWFKTMFFRHHVENLMVRELPPSDDYVGVNSYLVNSDEEIVRQGFEVEMETKPFHNFSVLSGFSYTHADPCRDSESKEKNSFTVALKYDDYDSFNIQLFGVYIHRFYNEDVYNSNYDHLICNIVVNKEINLNNDGTFGLFFSARNIFGGSQYPQEAAKNPDKSAEFGVKFRF